VTRIGIPMGLAANLLVGWLATRWSLAKLMGLATGLFAVALIAFPMVTTEMQVYAYALTLAAAGGGMTVCFFAVYRRAFGPARLGSIQGVAQMLTVLFSAIGPLVFASTKVRLGAYSPLFPTAAVIALILAILTWIVGMPDRKIVTPAANSEP
jgi:MFS family permease